MRLQQAFETRAGELFSGLWRIRRSLAMPFDLRRLRRHLEVVRRWDAPLSGPEELTVVGPVYNGASHVESFVEHHLALGASHVVLLDNASTDATVEIARRLDRVTVLRTRLAFARYSLAMRRHLTDQFGRGGWVLLADIDERLDYPFAEQLPLRGLLRYLNGAGFTSMFAQLLDLFPDGPASEWPPAGREAIAAAVWCDVESFTRRRLPRAARRNEFPAGEPVYLRGGVRALTLGGGAGLGKFPLLSRVGPRGPRLESAHFVSGGRVADVSGVLRHYKFDASFRAFCRMAVDRRSHFNRSSEYRAHLEALDADPRLVLRGPSARRYTTAAELLPTGIIGVSQRYREFVESWSRSGSAQR